MRRIGAIGAAAVCCLLVFVLCTPAAAQSFGSVSGTVSSSSGEALPGVMVTASGDTLPRSRTSTTNARGAYNLVQLPPGAYEISYSLDGMATAKRSLTVLLQVDSQVDVALSAEAVSEEVTVIASAALIDTTSTEIKVSLDNETIDRLPVGQEYRDVIKLIPGVQYSEDSVRGPSAGGSGQDNVYQFDGVNVGLPLFGVLSADPSSHDIDQVTIVKGGAKAVDFNRSGGFSINTISKSGTNAFHGLVSYQIQNDDTTGDLDNGSDSTFENDQDWATFALGGPLVRDTVSFYTSYYRPTLSRDNRANLYGDVPDFDSERDEFYGKLTITPADNLLFNLSYRDSDRETVGSGVGGDATAGTATSGSTSTLGIAIGEVSWVINDRSFASFRFQDFDNETSAGPDNRFGLQIADDGSVGLNVGALDTQGLFSVPTLRAGEDAYNAFVQPLIDRYGFVRNGVREGGGLVGGASTINDQNFFREGYEGGYDYQLETGNVVHDLHFGYQFASEEEELSRLSNGWGVITVPGGRTTFNGQAVFFEGRFEQQGLLSSSGQGAINSEFETQNIELNDNFSIGNWSFNIGLMVSNDTLFGEGLRANSSNVSGFELAPGNKYEMYEIDWSDTLSPRLGAVWNYGGSNTVYGSYAKYFPAAGSLPRAASWARNLRRSIRGYFDAAGNLIGTDPVGSSSGKFFQPDMTPRSVEEYIIGSSQQLNSEWTMKAHVRYRYGHNYWEDTNNNARSRFNPPAGIPTTDYIPELGDYRAEVGGSSYVIAELDGAYTKYWEAGLEADWRKGGTAIKGSYVWSHYYGNFDQDNTTTSNDAATFIGSSFIADGAGRQLWDFRTGDLRGDRRHQLKVYGSHQLPWNASAGFYAIFQSGQPWEAWDVEVYRSLTGSSSDTSRFAEPAGSRTTSDHYQLDLNYTHNFVFVDKYTVQLRVDAFNLFDNQTGYNIQNKVNSANFGNPRSFYNPRRVQLAAKFLF